MSGSEAVAAERQASQTLTEHNNSLIRTSTAEVAGGYMDIAYDSFNRSFDFSLFGIKRTIDLEGSCFFDVSLLTSISRRDLMFVAFEQDIHADLALGDASEIRTALSRVLEGTAIGVL